MKKNFKQSPRTECLVQFQPNRRSHNLALYIAEKYSWPIIANYKWFNKMSFTFCTFNCPKAEETFTILPELDNRRSGISASLTCLVP